MGAKITNIQIYLPEQVRTNEEISIKSGKWKPEEIEKKLGIKERRISDVKETAGDLAYRSAELIFKNYDRNKIDFIILCTQSPDYFLPTTACILQSRLCLRNNIGAFDYNLGCSGYIYGLAIAQSLVNNGLAKSLLLIMSETYSKHISEKDYSNQTIFGDASAATLIEYSRHDQIGKFVLGTDGSGESKLIVKNGAFKNRVYSGSADLAQQNTSDDFLYMNGPDIFNFTIKEIPDTIYKCLYENNLTINDVDYFIFHQANSFMIEYLRKKLNIPNEKFYSNILTVGNTVSATIPIALKDSLNNKIIKEKNKVLLCGFGVGFSWGAVIIEL